MATTTKLIHYPMQIQVNCFGGASWYSSSYVGLNVGVGGHGALGRNSAGTYRTMVIKFTTPSSLKTTTNKKISFRFTARSTSTAEQTGTFYYRIKTSGPSFTTNSPQFPAADASGVFSGTTSITFNGNAAKEYTITTGAHNFATNTTYYMWLLSEVPSNNAIGYISHDADNPIEVNFQVTDTVTYTKPGWAGMAAPNGFYSGLKVAACDDSETFFKSGYLYCNWTGRFGSFYRKEIAYNENYLRFNYGISLDADTTSTQKTLYYFYSPVDLGNPVNYYPAWFVDEYIAARYACFVYDRSSKYILYNSRDHANITLDSTPPSGYTFKGLATSPTSTGSSVNLPLSWSSSVDGKLYYCIYNKPINLTYYRGSSTAETATGTSIIYGTGQLTTSALKHSADYLVCASDSTYEFKGFAKNPTSAAVLYNSLSEAAMDTTTAYGVYSKDFEGMNKSGLLQTGGPAKTWSFTQSEGTNTYYGEGEFASNSTLNWNADVSYNGNIPYTSISPTGDANIGGTNYYEQDTVLTMLQKANDGDTIKIEYQGTDDLIYLDEDGAEFARVPLTILVNSLTGRDGVYIDMLDGKPIAYTPSSNYKFLGWYDTYGDKLNFDYNSYFADWRINDSLIRRVSPKLEIANDIYYGKNGEWKKAKIYKGINGQWVPLLMRYGKNSEWKNDYSYFNFTAFGQRTAYKGQTWADWLASDMNVDYQLQINNNGIVCEVTSMGLIPIIRQGFTDDIYGTDKIIEGAVYKTTL